MPAFQYQSVLLHQLPGGPTIYETKTFGVYYSVASSKWRIYIEDQTAIPQNLYFNVLIINP